MAQTIAIAQNTETDLVRTVTPMNGAWPKWNGTRTNITDGDIDTAIAGAASGTVFVLSSVVGNTLASTAIPAGVTLRGPPADALGTTLSVTGNITVGNNCTFRDMTVDNQSTKFTFSGNAWFENVRFTKDTIADDPPSSSSYTVTFSRCTFIKTRNFAWFEAGTTSQGNYVFLDCVFIDARGTFGSPATPLIKIGKGDITFKNCIFDTALASTHWFGQSAASPPGDMAFYNCVFESAPTDLTAITNVTGANNWSPTSPAVPIGATVNTRLNINTENYGHLLPTNASAFRSGGSSSYARRLDRNYLPYDASTPSAGAYQWQAESSCLVRQRTSNPLSGFSFTYGDTTTALSLWRLTVPSARADQDIIESHYITAAIVRAYVHDLVHPSRGDFYVTWDGYYRLVLNHGLFSLTTTGEAARFFGAQTLTDTGDTG